MSERKSFFAVDLDREELAAGAISDQPDQRWLAAVALGRVHENWACRLLWALKTDTDECTRRAATASLRDMPPELQRAVVVEELVVQTDFKPTTWKLKALPEYESTAKDLYLAAVVDLTSSEGPVTGARVQVMLTRAAQITGLRKISKGRTKKLLDELLQSNVLTRADTHRDSDDIDLWILHQPRQPEVVIRGRQGRSLAEIPVNESRAVLHASGKSGRGSKSRDAAFGVLMTHYEIKPNEFFLVGEAMSGQWQSLFTD